MAAGWSARAALALTLGLGAAAVVLLVSIVPREGLSPGHNVALIYVLAFGAALPAASAAGSRLALAASRRPGAAALPLTAAGSAALLALLLAGGRAIYEIDPAFPVTTGLLVGVGLWALASALVVRRVLGARPSPGRVGSRGAWAAVAVSVAAGVLAFLPRSLLGPSQLVPAIGAATLLVAVCLADRRPVRSPKARRLLDLGTLALILVVASDIGFLTDRDYLAFRGQVHQDFYLAPLNELLAGRPLLVDTVSQYGVGMLLFLAGVFVVVPVGYATLGVLSGVLTSLMLCAVYGTLRLGGCRQATSAAAVGVAIVACVLGGAASPSIWPSSGALRYGIPFLLVLVTVLASRSPHPGRLLRVAPPVLVGLGSLWSAETFLYTAVVYAAVAAFGAATGEPGRRARSLARALALAGIACVAIHAVFALLTLVLAGSWPDWGVYLSLLGVYDDELGDVAVLAPWPPVVIVGATYFASAASLAIATISRPQLAASYRSTFTALVGLTALGVVVLTTYLGKPQAWILHNVAVPAVALGPLWLVVMEGAGVARRARTIALVAACCLAALAVVSAWPAAERHLPRTPAGLAIDRGRSLRFEVNNLRALPPTAPLAAEGSRLVERYMPSEGPALVLPQTDQELATEVLIRTGRPNALPISHPSQDLLLERRSRARIRAAIDRLRPGTPMLVDSARPPRDSFDVPGRVPLQTFALDTILRRFDLQVVARGNGGMAVVRLVAKRTPRE